MNPAAPERTELEWTYQPSDFFAANYAHEEAEYSISIDAGRVVASLRTPQDPIGPALAADVEGCVRLTFQIRFLQKYRTYELKGPHISQHRGGVSSVEIRTSSDTFLRASDSVEVLLEDTDGNVIRETRAERIAQEMEEVKSLLHTGSRSPLLRSMLTSFERSFSDHANALVHLYEVRDMLAKHYGGEASAVAALGISGREWARIGHLANGEPLEEGRHRGQYPEGRRSATEAELNEARGIVTGWIRAFADRV